MRSSHRFTALRFITLGVSTLVAAIIALAMPTVGRAQEPADTYMDATARIMVRDARLRRLTVDQSITEYRALSTERLSIQHRIVGRDRLLFRRETASRVHWSRTGAIEINVIGAREVVPLAVSAPQIPGDLTQFMPHIAFDPMDAELLFRFDTTAVIHPFSELGDQNYRFRTGDSTSIKLPDGRTIRLRELEFIPRRNDPHLIAGSFWIDSDSHAVVQAVFRLARQFDFSTDGDKKDRPPGWFPAMSFDLSYLAVDYGLYDFRWWLPRYVVAEGVVKLGPMGTMPQKYERTYSEYEVKGDTSVGRIARDSMLMRSCRAPMELSISVSTGDQKAVDDSVAERRNRERTDRRKARRDSIMAKDSAKNGKPTCVPREYTITKEADSVLLKSEYLPGSVYDGETLLSQSELDDIAARVGSLPDVGWGMGRPRIAGLLGGPGLIRYNRIEGLSLGARAQIDLGRAGALGELRYGFAQEKVSAEVALLREATSRSYRLGGYARLAATDPSLKPFSLPSSLGAVLLGIDDAKYFRATGAELLVSPAASRSQWYSFRLYHEKQTDVDVNTEFSVRHLLHKPSVFSDNIEAPTATQSGSDITLRRDFGLDPAKLRGGIEAGAKGELGTFDFARPSATLRMSAPMPFKLVAAVEGAVGTSTGNVPAQSQWYLGGTSSLRGYQIGARSGNAFWRGRAEVATSLPIARLALFSDFGWAGNRTDFAASRPLVSAGAGFSFLDGVIRLDVAHALRESKATRVYLYMGGVF